MSEAQITDVLPTAKNANVYLAHSADKIADFLPVAKNAKFVAQEIVREFTMGANNAVYPDGSSRPSELPVRPILANSKQCLFITKMVISELLEMLMTFEPSPDKVKALLHQIVDDLDLPTSAIPHTLDATLDSKTEQRSDVIEAQMDAVADVMYYLLDFSTKHGYNIDRILSLVHGANMAKKHADGKFHKRDDGKVIKPPNWKEADLGKEVERQIREGAWHTNFVSELTALYREYEEKMDALFDEDLVQLKNSIRDAVAGGATFYLHKHKVRPKILQALRKEGVYSEIEENLGSRYRLEDVGVTFYGWSKEYRPKLRERYQG
jgi:predicted HAD superfamily Cof-like phosphohydrolase